MHNSLDVSAPGHSPWILDWTCYLRTLLCHVYIPYQWQRYNQAVILSTVFPRLIGNSFMMCVNLESNSEDILEEADPLHSFVDHMTNAQMTASQRATTIPKKSNPWFDEECREALKASGPWTREFDRVDSWEGKPYLLVMGRNCIKAVSWNSYKACVG